MAHHTNHRRNLAAALDPKPSMDPTHKKHPISTSSSSTTKPHHLTHPDPTLPPSTIQNISNNFSKLYTNHKILTSTRGSTDHSHPSVDTHLQAKAMTVSSNLNNSCTTLTKSKSQHGSTRTMIKEVVKVKVPFEVHDIDKAFVKQKAYETKKPSSMKESKSKEFYYEEEEDLKKASSALMMSRSYEGGDEMKRFQEGCEMKRPSFSLAVNNGGRRRSFCSSQTELADFFSCNGVKVVSVDMPPFMQIHVVDCARKTYDSLEKFTARTLACTLKKEFDGVYGPAWHCIVGTSFGSFVTHSVGGFMYFSMDHKLYVLLFKTTVQKAE